MTRIEWFLSRPLVLRLVAWCSGWLVALAPAMALAQEQSASGTAKKYVGPYALVLMLIAAALVVVCKSARRRTEIKKRD